VRKAGQHLRDVARSTPGISNVLHAGIIDDLFDDIAAIRNADIVIDRLNKIG
jgi:hypothetical protein